MAFGIVKALKMIKDMPRVAMNNIKDLPNAPKKKRGKRKTLKGGARKRKRELEAVETLLPPIGNKAKPVPGYVPYYIRIPKEPYYENHGQRKQYLPLTLLQLQRAIDLGRLDPEEPIDLVQLCNTGLWKPDLDQKQYGFNVTDEGVDAFSAKVNLEVQWTSEPVIAAVERNGGVITTRYYDPMSLQAMTDTRRFFQKGVPIPKCKYPSRDVIDFYSSARNRGYLADPDEIRAARFELAQKYGYELADLSTDPLVEMLTRRKDPRQIFHGLHPGWVILLKNRQVLKPVDDELMEYYAT